MLSSSTATHSFSHRLRVRYADTDLQGHVYFGSYYTYLDEALMALLRQLGFSWQQLAARGLEFYYAESHCSYLAPCYAEEELDIQVGFDKLGSSSLRSWMMLSQKVIGWLSKNFALQGLVVFQGRRHTYSMSRSCKNAVTPEGGLFATPSWMTISRPDGQVAARGFITAVMVAAANGRPTPLPADLRAAIATQTEESP